MRRQPFSRFAVGVVCLFLAGCSSAPPTATNAPSATATSDAGSTRLVDFGFTGEIQNLFRKELAEPFMAAHPGVTVELTGGISEDAIAQIKAAQGASPYDTMLLGQPRYLQAQREGWILQLTPQDVPNVAEVYPNVQEKCSPGAVAWTVETIGVMYSPDRAKPPASWADLWSPEYKGRIGLARPSSNAGFLFMVMIAKLFGKSETDFDTVFTKLHELEPFVVAPNPESLSQLIEREEIDIAINWSTEAAVSLGRGARVEFTFPAPGPIAQVGCYAVLKKTAHPELAKAYVNEALGTRFQTAMSQAPWYFAPVNRNVKVSPESAKLIPSPESYDSLIIATDLAAVLELREAATDRFTREFGN